MILPLLLLSLLPDCPAADAVTVTVGMTVPVPAVTVAVEVTVARRSVPISIEVTAELSSQQFVVLVAARQQ